MLTLGTMGPELTPVMMALLVLIGIGAGLLGALVGIGGGILIVPILSIGLGIDLRVAVATSLISVIGTSTAAGSVYVGSGQANMRLGMTLEVTTTIGGIVGGVVAILISPATLEVAFALMLVLTAVLMARGAEGGKKVSAGAGDLGGYEEAGGLAGAYYDPLAGHMVHYRASRVAVGSAVALVAGMLSGMLGVGGGFLKVPAMTLGMRVPMRVATATSNFMIGVTAVASLVVYFARGFVHPTLASPVVLGVVLGSLVGTKVAPKLHPRMLRWVLAVVLVGVAIQMFLRGTGIGR